MLLAGEAERKCSANLLVKHFFQWEISIGHITFLYWWGEKKGEQGQGNQCQTLDVLSKLSESPEKALWKSWKNPEKGPNVAYLTVLDNTGPFWSILDDFGPYLTIICQILESFWPHGPFWSILDNFGPFERKEETNLVKKSILVKIFFVWTNSVWSCMV